ncbi:sensor domain-containing diguanylate cyclase [Thermomonas brevis]
MDRIPTLPPSSIIVSLAESLENARSLEELVRPLLQLLEATTGLESTYMTTIDERAGVQHILFARNSDRLQIPEGLSVPWSDTLCKRALDEGRSYTDDVEGHWGDSDAARALGIATYASVPIHGAEGVLHGTLCAASGQRQPMHEGAERVMRLFAHLIGQQVEREALFNRLKATNAQLHLSAMTDMVTGLANRRALMEELNRRLQLRKRTGTEVLIAFIDLDGFKRINDVHGHDAGDRFLAAIGRALADCMRADDFCGRLAGDEFVVIGTVCSASDACQQALEARLRAACSGQFELGDVHIDYTGPSIGVIRAGDGDAERELARADEAMYEDKRRRRGAAT